MLGFLFGNKSKKKEFSEEEACQQLIRNPNEGVAFIKCNKPLFINDDGKKECSVNTKHDIRGEGPPV